MSIKHKTNNIRSYERKKNKIIQIKNCVETKKNQIQFSC